MPEKFFGAEKKLKKKQREGRLLRKRPQQPTFQEGGGNILTGTKRGRFAERI